MSENRPPPPPPPFRLNDDEGLSTARPASSLGCLAWLAFAIGVLCTLVAVTLAVPTVAGWFGAMAVIAAVVAFFAAMAYSCR